MGKIQEFLNNKSLFRVLFVSSAFLQPVTFIDSLSYIVTGFLSFWGIYLLIKNFRSRQQFTKVLYWQHFVIFTLLCIVTIVLRIYLGFIGAIISIATLLLNLIFFFVFFGAHIDDVKVVKSEVYYVARFIMTIVTVCSVIGLILLLLFHRAVWIGSKSLIIYENRFKGLFINPNPQAFVCFTAILSSIILSCKGFTDSINKKSTKKGIAVFCIAVNTVCLMLSASNSGLLLLACFIFGYLFYLMFAGKGVLSAKNIAVRTMCFALACFICISGLFLIRSGVSFVSGKVISGKSIISENVLAPTPSQYASELQPEGGRVTFTHINKTLDSGRLKLYKKALTYITKYPVTGAGYGNVFYEGYSKRGGFYDFHNAYLTLGASNGLIAFCVIMLFGLKVIIRIGRCVSCLNFKFGFSILPSLFAFVCAYCVYAFVEPTMFYYPTHVVVVFWFLLGAAFSITLSFEKQGLVNRKTLFGNTNIK